MYFNNCLCNTVVVCFCDFFTNKLFRFVEKYLHNVYKYNILSHIQKLIKINFTEHYRY